MTESELSMLATHLGHDPKTHREFYRLAHSTLELTKVIICFNLEFLYFLYFNNNRNVLMYFMQCVIKTVDKTVSSIIVKLTAHYN
jgi:hypothetical protein